MSPAVITSKAAANDLAKIKVAHADIVTGMTDQKQRVDTFNQVRDQQKAAEMQNKATMDNEIKKESMVQNTAMAKNTMDAQLKQSELDIKRAASATT